MYMSHYQKVHNGQTQPGCMKAMMYFLPLISVYWAWIMPSAVGLYWVISSVTSFLQSLITNKYFSIDHMIARGEAQRAVTLELAEAKARPLPAATQQEIAEKLAAAPQQQKLEKGGGKKQQGGKKKEGGSGGSGTVSYTHLDVYKRQVVQFSFTSLLSNRQRMGLFSLSVISKETRSTLSMASRVFRTTSVWLSGGMAAL